MPTEIDKGLDVKNEKAYEALRGMFGNSWSTVDNNHKIDLNLLLILACFQEHGMYFMSNWTYLALTTFLFFYLSF